MDVYAFVKNPQGRTYVVKNLGWMLRHMSKSVVKRVEVEPYLSDNPNGVQILRVYFEDGFEFTSSYNSPIVLRWFLSRRRALFWVPLVWHGRLLPADWQESFKGK